MTTKQRNKAYKEAMKILPKTKDWGVSFSLCKAMGSATNLSFIEAMNLPEISLFNELGSDGYWFDYNDLQTRQIILDFCIAMTEN